MSFIGSTERTRGIESKLFSGGGEGTNHSRVLPFHGSGPDPWKANTLEWYTSSPPPEHNFDAIPRVRSVEPMKDVRRQVEEQTGAEQRFQTGRPMARV